MIIEKNFEYKITENDGKKTIAITKYLGNEEIVTIPDEIDNIPVTVIDEHSLRNKNIRQIIIPQNIVSIKQNAIPSKYHILLCFKNSELPSWWNHRVNKYIYFRTILNFLYSGKTSDNFEYAVIFDGKDKKVAITEYKGEAENLKIPNYIEDIPVEIITKKAFNNCSTLKTVTLPLTLNKLCWLGFQGCENLHSIFIPNCIEYITEDAINFCNNVVIYCFAQKEYTYGEYSYLNSYTRRPFICGYIKDGVTEDGFRYAISDDKTEKYVSITGYIGTKKDIEIPDMIEGYPVRILENMTFSNRDDLTSIIVPKTIKKVFNRAFPKTKKLTVYFLSDKKDFKRTNQWNRYWAPTIFNYKKED